MHVHPLTSERIMPCMTGSHFIPSSRKYDVMVGWGVITRESENPGSHALIPYLRSTLQWFGVKRTGACVDAWDFHCITIRNAFLNDVLKRCKFIFH